MPPLCKSLLTSVCQYKESLKRRDCKGHEGLGNLIYNTVKHKGLLHDFESGSLVQEGAYGNKSCIFQFNSLFIMILMLNMLLSELWFLLQQ